MGARLSSRLGRRVPANRQIGAGRRGSRGAIQVLFGRLNLPPWLHERTAACRMLEADCVGSMPEDHFPALHTFYTIRNGENRDMAYAKVRVNRCYMAGMATCWLR